MMYTKRTRSLLLLWLVAASAAPVVAQDPRTCFDDTTAFSPSDWDFCLQIHDDPPLFMYYKPMPEQGNLMLGLHATKETLGWTALAFAGNGGMKGASQIVVRQVENSDSDTNSGDPTKWIAEDRNSQAYSTPVLDESQDVKLLFANQTEEGETSWGVLLPLQSCDAENVDYPVQDISRYMHWALGEDADHGFFFHGARRGQFHANLMRPPPEDSAMSSAMTLTAVTKQANPQELQDEKKEDLLAVEILMPNIDVVIGEEGGDPTNPYKCTFFDWDKILPNADPDSIVHVTRLSPVLHEPSEPYVHHMILYSCEVSPLSATESLPAHLEHGKLIDHCQSMPPGCTFMRWPFAVGTPDTILPKDVGVPFGGAGKGRNWLGLQMHYYNPNLHENVVDNSGVRLHYTEEIRAQDAGYLQVNGGTHPFMRPEQIPVGHTDYEISPFVVPSSCTAEIWDEPINILGVGHHMHLSGKLMSIEVERNGENLGPLRIEKGYDFNHQSGEPSNIPQLLPGDQLNMHCHYDTSRLTEDVSFGELTQNEMCYAVIFYYPKQVKEDFGRLPTYMDSKLCTTPGTGDENEFGNVSLCAQQAFENVPKFYDFENLSPVPFDGVYLCNSDFYETMVLPNFPYGMCPDCYKEKNCTFQQVLDYAQDGTCARRCRTLAGVSVYPDINRTEEDKFDQGVYGCGPTDVVDVGWQFFKKPELVLVPMCEAAGDLHQTIEFLFEPSAARTISINAATASMSGLEDMVSSGPWISFRNPGLFGVAAVLVLMG